LKVAFKRLLSRALVRAGIVTYLFSGLTLVANLATGIISARALGPDGRGVAIALATIAQLGGFLFALGVAQSLSYLIARRPGDGATLLTTWTLMLLPIGGVAIGTAQLLLPTIFPSEPEAVSIGRWFMFSVVLVIGTELNYGLLLGIQDFTLYNVLRVAQPMLTAVSFVVLWQAGELTVTSALVAPTAATALVLAVGFARAVAVIGIGRPSVRAGARSLWVGIRGQGSSVANNVTARLDVAMLPAYVSSASVGIYSVATNISLVVFQLASTFAGLVLPAAASEPERSRIKIIGSLWAVMAIAAVMAVVLGVFAEPLLNLVYGEDFRGAAESLRLLLPGAVLFAGSSILAAGIYAAGRPLTATLTQLLGMAVTVVGLVAFLSTGGITAAALVSSASYGAIFVASLLAYKAVSGVSWSEFAPTRARLRALAR
jgi:O-antigen/teichoic acid export membrane protein